MTASTNIDEGRPVAIVGIGCRFPGGVTDPGSFWRLLSEGADAITEIPADRINLEHYFDPRPATPGRMMTRWGGFLDHIDELDAYFFGISPREAERLDPQQRLLLETAWEALEDAGQDVGRLEGSPTAVFVGQWLSDFESRLFADPEGVDFQMTTGSGRYAASGRISYALGLRGPSLTLDSACSSSLAAIHLAVRSIRSGESTMALAGGVNVILQPHISVAYSQSRMMAPDGHCKFGDASGDGYVRSEGAGLVVLKPLESALADGDRIYALIRGSAVNNDGHSSGSMGTPSRIGQEELLRTAYRDARVSPGCVGYIEAHGTGTRAGDPVELGALASVLGEGRAPGDRAWVGSVKTNIGHTEGAAGVAGLIKVALALHHGKIPRSLHCNQLNPQIPWDDVPLAIPREHTDWPNTERTRLAGVSAFGIAGTNAHVVLEQAPESSSAQPSLLGDNYVAALLPLSAKNPEALRAMAARYAKLLEANDAPSLQDICWCAATRRTALDHRAAFVATDCPGMLDALRRFSGGEAAAADGILRGNKRPRIAFVVPGQGAQWTGMARELSLREPVFHAALQRCDAAARPYADWSIIEQLAASPETAGYQLDQIDVIQPVLIAIAIAYAALWRSKGIEPDAVVGHSMGEVGAACIAGVLDLEQAMRIICRRSALMRRTSGQGAMALVELAMDEARARIKGREAQLSVAVSNSPRSSVISGDPQAVQQVMTELERDQVFCRLVKVDVASHSPQMEPLAIELAAELAGLTPHEANIPIYSTVLGRRAEAPEFEASYWARNLRQPVLFAETVGRLIDDGVTVFIELGPHPVLLPSVQQTAQSLGTATTAIACGRRDEPEHVTFWSALGALWCAGQPLDWTSVMSAGGRAVSLPLYPWQRERHWIAVADIDAGGTTRRRGMHKDAPRHALLGPALELGDKPPGKLWEPDLNIARMPFLGEHRLHGAALLAASVYVEFALAAVRALNQGGAVLIDSLTFEQALYLDSEAPASLQLRAQGEGGAMALTWHSAGETGWTRHASARVTRVSVKDAPETTMIVHSPAGRVVEGAALYARLESAGAFFGQSLRGIRRAWIDGVDAWAELGTPTGGGPPPEHFEIPPSALDACFQLAVASRNGDDLWLPSGVSRVWHLQNEGSPTLVQLHTRDGGEEGAQVLDVILHGSQGPLLHLEGLRLQRLAGKLPRDPQQWLFDIAWVPSPLPATEPTPRAYVLLTDRAGVGELLAAGLRDSGAAVVVLAPNMATDSLTLTPLLEQASQGAAKRPVDVIMLRGIDLDEPSPQADAALLDLTHVIQELDGFDRAPRRCWLVTCGARVVFEADAATLALAQAPLWGLGSAAATEHPTIWGGCVDLDPCMPPAQQAAWLLQELAMSRGGDAAVRAGQRFTPALHQLEANVPGPRATLLRADASYLVTGGLGGVGTHLAHWLIKRGARRLAILGRTPLPLRADWATTDPGSRSGRAITSIRALETQGASVCYAAVDVADEAALRGFLDQYAREQWPPIRGVIHAAGVIDDCLVAELGADSLHKVLAGKLHGAWNLHRLQPDLDFFVLFSSVASFMAQPGQASYAAANAFLDALAHRRRARGRSALSINWGVWEGVGFAGTEGGAQALAQLARLGIEPFTAPLGLAALGLLLERDLAQAAVLPLDAHVLRQAIEARSLPPFTLALLESLSAQPRAAGASGPAGAESFVAHLLQVESPQQRQQLELRLTAHASTILRLGSGRLDRRTPMGSYGLNSLMALELRNRIELDLGLPLSATVLWNYPTIAALAEHLLGRITPTAPAIVIAAAPGGSSAEQTSTLAEAMENVEGLSEEAALAALVPVKRPAGGPG